MELLFGIVIFGVFPEVVGLQNGGCERCRLLRLKWAYFNCVFCFVGTFDLSKMFRLVSQRMQTAVRGGFNAAVSKNAQPGSLYIWIVS